MMPNEHPVIRDYLKYLILIDVVAIISLSLFFVVMDSSSFESLLPWILVVGALSGPFVLLIGWIYQSAWGSS